jgi:general secretion pathway protein F
MPRFHFIAATPANEKREGIHVADHPDEVLRKLRSQGLFVVKVEPETAGLAVWRWLNRDLGSGSSLGARALAGFTEELGGLVEAGLPVEEALGLLQLGQRHAAARAVFAELRKSIREGAALHEALAAQGVSFPATYVAFVRAAEAAGILGPSLKRMADDLAAKEGFTADIRNALLYPSFLLVTASAGITILLGVVVPGLEQLLADRNHDLLPLATRGVIAASHALRSHGAYFAIVSVVALASVAGARLTEGGRLLTDRLLLRVPMLGSILRSLETGRWSRTLGGLLRGGLPVAQAMPFAIAAVGNRAIQLELRSALVRILGGVSIADAVDRDTVLPADAIGIVRVGERTGQLASALERAAAIHEVRARRGFHALTIFITPMLTVVFGLLAGIIVYAMLSTILSLNELALP